MQTDLLFYDASAGQGEFYAVPRFSIQTMLDRMRQVYVSAGIRVSVSTQRTLNLPALLTVDVGSCSDGFGDNITGDVADLYRNRGDVSENDVAIFFVQPEDVVAPLLPTRLADTDMSVRKYALASAERAGVLERHPALRDMVERIRTTDPEGFLRVRAAAALRTP